MLHSERSFRAKALSCFGSGVRCKDQDPEKVSTLRTLVAPCLVPSSTVGPMYPILQEHLQTSLVPSTGNGDKGLAEMQFTSDHPNADTSDLHSRPALPLADCPGRNVVLDLTDPRSRDSNPTTTEPSGPPQPPSIVHLKSLYPPKKTNTHPSRTRLILPFTIH